MARMGFKVWLAAVAVVAATASGAAAQRVALIRDAEIEDIIRDFATPIFQVAGLNPDAIQVHLLRDDRLNAFVAGGQNLFINTGLLIRAEDPGELIGVIAHESGHIAGGHLARLHDALNNLSTQNILAFVVGGVVGVLSGRPDLAAATLSAAQSMSARSLLAYTRANESSADQAALTYLDRVGWSSRGLDVFLSRMEDQELLSPEFQDPYLRTHPLTADRLAAVRAHGAASPNAEARFPDDFYLRHARMRAKLIGYLYPLERVLRIFPESDASLPARYARAIAYAEAPDLARALPLIDGLIAERPNDPYFLELKGDALYNNGRVDEALAPLRAAVAIEPEAALMRLTLSRVLLADENSAERAAQARTIMLEAVRLEPRNATMWQVLAIAHGRVGDLGQAALAMAERSYLNDDMNEARSQAIRAQQNLEQSTPGWLRAQDILRATDPDR